MSLLSVNGLKIFAGNDLLVKGIDFNIDRGEILAIVGESGSGKSLSCLSLLNLLPKELKVEGQATIHLSEKQTFSLLNMDSQLRKTLALNHISYIFQEPLSALNPVKTCGNQLLENVQICLQSNKKGHLEKARELLNKVELHDFDKVMKSYPYQLSGGQRQRVMIAMSLAGNPDLIIADEPTTALDVVLQDEILGLIKRIVKEQNKSLILVSHDLDAVAQFSDRILVMYKGELVEQGKSKDIIQHPKELYTKALIACKPKPEHKGQFLNTIHSEMENNGLTSSFLEPAIGETLIVKTNLLSKYYKQGKKYFHALKTISFEIHKGQSVGLIGESGSGKSTISKLLVGLELSNGGEIVYDFENNLPLSSNVQMIFQDPFAALNPALSVKSMLQEVIYKHQSSLNSKQVEEEIETLLLKVGLQSSDQLKYPSNFSGGQRQRLCIARALAAKPQLLICDESTSALDLSVQAQILNLLKHLQLTENLSLLVITHSMAVAAWFCQYLVVLKDGYIIEQGNTETLINQASNEYTQLLLKHV
jgi:peptide/nickel transport system ATP-binding protein